MEKTEGLCRMDVLPNWNNQNKTKKRQSLFSATGLRDQHSESKKNKTLHQQWRTLVHNLLSIPSSAKLSASWFAPHMGTPPGCAWIYLHYLMKWSFYGRSFVEVIQFKTDWFWSYVYQTLSVIYAYTGPWKQRVFGNYYKLFAYLIWMHICLSMFDRNLAVTRIAQMLSDGVSFCRKQRHCGRGYKNVKDWINGGLNLKKNMKTRRVISITRRPTPISSARASFENGVPLPYIRLFSISVIECMWLITWSFGLLIVLAEPWEPLWDWAWVGWRKWWNSTPNNDV